MRCAVLGDPVAHSLSPVLHAAAHRALGLVGWHYERHRVAEGGLAGFLAGLAATDFGGGPDGGGAEWRGLSLTMPLKREALGLADVVGERAALTGAANTLVLPEGAHGPRHVDNTDLPGAVAAVRERHDGAVTAGVVLGGGATAASTALALCDLGATTVTVLARSPERAGPTADVVRAHPSGPEVRVAPLVAEEVRRAPGEALVSTVPATAQTPELLAAAAGRALVFEVLYDPWPTPLARAAEAAGSTVVGGLDLLVHQAALQVTAFCGLPAPLGTMRAAGEAALAGRSGVDRS